jgi:hypothetical protein
MFLGSLGESAVELTAEGLDLKSLWMDAHIHTLQ